MATCSSVELLFVHATSANPPIRSSKIRRDVMQKVAMRRKREAKNRMQSHPNSRQLPVFVSAKLEKSVKAPFLCEAHLEQVGCYSKDQEQEFDHLRRDKTGYAYDPFLQCVSPTLPIFANPPAILMKANLGFLNFSTLASFEIGRYTGERLLATPSRFTNFLGTKSWSYFWYVPARYDSCALLRIATDCVAARVRHLLAPSDSEWGALALRCYAKALSEVQRAINASAGQKPSAEVLCATQILGLYEVSDHNPTAVTHSRFDLI